MAGALRGKDLIFNSGIFYSAFSFDVFHSDSSSYGRILEQARELRGL